MSAFTPAHRGGAGPPLVLLHGITDTWRSWELVLPTLERHHDVLAPTLLGHAGAAELPDAIDHAALADAVEAAMDDAGFATAHVAGNSLGGYVALQLAERGRARTVVALAPAGGWAEGDPETEAIMEHFPRMAGLLEAALPHVDAIVASPEGRRRATAHIATEFEHIPPELIAHLMRGAGACAGMPALVAFARREGWELHPERVACPVRIVWGTEDRLLGWPSAAARYREWFPHADWVELEGVGHCPQLDVPLEAAQLILGMTAS